MGDSGFNVRSTFISKLLVGIITQSEICIQYDVHIFLRRKNAKIQFILSSVVICRDVVIYSKNVRAHVVSSALSLFFAWITIILQMQRNNLILLNHFKQCNDKCWLSKSLQQWFPTFFASSPASAFLKFLCLRPYSTYIHNF